MTLRDTVRNPANLLRRELLLLNSNLGRLLYDFLVFAVSAFGASALAYLYSDRIHLSFIAVPFIGLIANYFVGVYGRFRVGGGRLKAAILSASCLTVFVYLAYSTQDIATSCLWVCLAWAPLILPRMFLNLNRKSSSSSISRTLNSAIKGRGPVLVVGGGGYIGSHVVGQLLQAGFSVRVLDSLFYGKDSLLEFAENQNFELIVGDVTDISKLVRACDGASAVVHLAGLVGDPACALNESYTLHSNVIVTKMLKEVALSAGVQRFIFASSCSVYGANDAVVDETSELNPVSLYARTKIASEKELLASVSDEFFVTILRFATVFGHSRRPRFDLVGNLFTAQAYNDGRITVFGGDSWRPFIHVADIARAIVLTLKANPFRVQGQIMNVGDSRLNMTIGELAEKVQSVVMADRSVEIVSHQDSADRRNYNVSFDKIRRIIGFTATYLIEDGVSEMLSEFKRGTYVDYKASKFSNLEVTKQVVMEFQNPKNIENLYRPYSVSDVVGG
jgi:nucleoside-diphosphate-sugar epimerase